jgi:hypothetical protein
MTIICSAIAAGFLAIIIGLAFWLHKQIRLQRYWLAMFYIELLTSEGWYANGLKDFEGLHSFVVRSCPIPLHVLDSSISHGLNAAIEATINRKKASRPSRPRKS